MKISAIPSDHVIVIDGIARHVDLTGVLDANIHAVQWDDAKGGGWIEYSDPLVNEKTTLQSLRDLLLAAWTAAEPPPVPPLDPQILDRVEAERYVLEAAIKTEAAKPTAPDYVKRAAAQLVLKGKP